ncbi:MAG TPA: SDR family NAD(P)-dependent oxidoreductase [Acidimicrobiales bacterium]|nr:SDR family NAD(P)-dependent oxidoreductase [Acidimicrobiales bacterium]
MEIFEDRTAVVTGAASGIGLAITEAFLAEGMNVVMTDVNEEQLTKQGHRLRNQGADVHIAVADVSDPLAVEAVAMEALDCFGKLHVAVNNAGIVNGGAAWELSLEEWHKVVDVNLWGVIHGVRSFLPRILSSGEGGHVVNTASLAAVVAVKHLGPYTVAKHGILGLSDVLRADLEAIGAPVGVSVVMPGLTRTGMNPIGTVPASQVAMNVVDGIRRGRRYVFTDDHHIAEVETRLSSILAARSDVID